jgi:hypothetical protein
MQSRAFLAWKCASSFQGLQDLPKLKPLNYLHALCPFVFLTIVSSILMIFAWRINAKSGQVAA